MAQATVCALLLSAFALRVPTLARESFWRDEIDAVLFASAPWAQLLGGFAQPQHNGPAFHAVLRVWTEAVGQSEFAVRYLSTLADLVSVGLLVALGRRLGGAAVGLAAGALWAVLPAAL
jgi:mannosyltransferase